MSAANITLLILAFAFVPSLIGAYFLGSVLGKDGE